MEVYIIKRPDHFPQKYLAEWSINGNAYSCWFYTQKEYKEYFSNCSIVETWR